MEEVRPIRILWFGIYNPSYPRNNILLKGLRAKGAEIVECKEEGTGLGRHLRLIRKLRALRGTYDVLYVAYPAPSVALWAYLFGSGPLFVDAFYSMYDAVVCDRREISKMHPRAWKLWALDLVAALVGDVIVADTTQHARYLASWPLVRRSKFCVVPIGVDNGLFTPIHKGPHDPSRFKVLFHGTYIPLHGAHHIVDTAALLSSDARISFTFVGKGGLYEEIVARIKAKGVTNITVVGEKVPITEIMRHISEHDVVLGIFGETAKASRVVPNKVYEGLAMRKPIITMDSPAIREFFAPEDMLLVPNDPERIAAAILELCTHREMCLELASRGYTAVERYFPEKLGDMLLGYMRDALRRR